MKQRVQKILAAAGIGSRRECERLIEAGRVKVNRKLATLGDQADPDEDEIRVDGDVVKAERKRHYLVYKPRGYICSSDDEYGRRRVIDLLPRGQERLYTVGRLDAESEGLIIVTNDGDLAHRLTHPRYGVTKTYHVEIGGRVEPPKLELLRKGVWSSAGKLAAESVKIVRRGRTRTTLEFILAEGKNRAIRRMLARAGHKVRRLCRIKIASVADPALEPGAYRPLTPQEVQALRKASEPTMEHSRQRSGRK